MTRLPSNLLRPLRHATVCLAALAAPSAWPLEAGVPMPDLTLPGIAEAVTLAKLKGKVVYVDFWASWCGPCKQSFPFMNDLQARHRSQGFEIVAVNVDARREDADRFLNQVPASFTVAFDPKAESAKRFEVKGMPSSFLVGRDGRIVAAHKGFREEDRQELERLIGQALEAK